MAKQLKSTGLAARSLMCAMVDPDTNAIKDFASATVTSTMAVGANVTVGDLTWDGLTQKYFRNGAGATDADFVKFVTNKPGFTVGAGSTQFTLVCLVQAENAETRVMGTASQDYFFSLDSGSGGATYPRLWIASNAFTAGLSAIAVGAKKLFGFNINRSGSGNWFEAFDTDSTINSGSLSFGAIDKTWALDYLGRRNDSTTNRRGYFVLIGIFSGQATAEELQALLDNPSDYLLEAAGAGGITGTASQTLDPITQSAEGTVVSGITGSASQTLDPITQSADGTVTGAGAITGTAAQTLAAFAHSAAGTVTTPSVVLGPFKNNTGGLLASQAIAHALVVRASDRNVTLSLAGLSTDGSGFLTIPSTSLVVGTAYMGIAWNADGTAAGIKRAVAS